jgi:hypothetical protein
MAVVNAVSDQLTQLAASPKVPLYNDVQSGKLRFAYFTLTQVGAGDAASVQALCKLPAGRIRILRDLCKINTSAFGASRTLAVGHTGYTGLDGTVVAAAPSFLASAIDVSAAANNTLAGAAASDPTLAIDSRSGVTFQSAVAAGTIPDAATIKGYIAYIHE